MAMMAEPSDPVSTGEDGGRCPTVAQ